MIKNRIGQTDIEVTILGFGGIKLKKDLEEKPEDLVHRALDLGINYIDTARSYGESEVFIGNVMKERREECSISSKSIRRSASETAEDIEDSLKRMQTDMIDIYFCHDLSEDEDYEQAVSPSGSLSALQKARKAGKIRYIAVSTHRKTTALRAIQSGEFDVIMLAINLFDKEFIRDVIPVAREHGVGIVGMKPLAGGAFLHPQIALRYSLGQDIDTQLVGIASMSELEEDFSIADSFEPLSQEDLQKLEDDAKSLGKDFCRQCGYCIPCPQGIDIPKIFLYERYSERFWLPDFAKKEYLKLNPKADACEECGHCESACPYDLPIIEKLKKAHKILKG